MKKTTNKHNNKTKFKCSQFIKLLKSVVCKEDLFIEICVYTHLCVSVCVCVYIYIDIWVVISLPPNFGEIKSFVLLGLFGHLHDASKQECGCKVPSGEVYFLCQLNWTEKYVEM